MTAKDRNEIFVEVWPLKIVARGRLAILLMALPLATLLVSLAGRLAAGWFIP